MALPPFVRFEGAKRGIDMVIRSKRFLALACTCALLGLCGSAAPQSAGRQLAFGPWDLAIVEE